MSSMPRAWSRKLGLLPLTCLLAGCASGGTGGTGPGRRDPAAEIELPADHAPADFGKIRADMAKFKNRGPIRSYTRGTCEGCVDIQSIGNTTTINPTSVLTHARVIGRIKNNGTSEESNYKLKAGTEYLVYLEPNSSGAGARLSLFELPVSGTGTATKIDLGPIQVCHRYQASDRVSDTDFRDYSECIPAIPPRDSMRRSGNSQGPGPSLISRFFGGAATARGTALTATSGVWFECDPGCCVGSAF